MKLGTHFLWQDTPTPEAIAFFFLANWLQDNGIEDFKYVARLLALRLASKGHTLTLGVHLKQDGA